MSNTRNSRKEFIKFLFDHRSKKEIGDQLCAALVELEKTELEKIRNPSKSLGLSSKVFIKSYILRLLSNIYGSLLGQSAAVRPIILEERLDFLLIRLKMIYKSLYPEDKSDAELDPFFADIRSKFKEGILWQYNDTVIKNFFIKDFLYSCFQNKFLVWPIFNHTIQNIKQYFPQGLKDAQGNDITFNEIIWKEITTTVAKEFYEKTVPGNPNRFLLGTLVLSSLFYPIGDYPVVTVTIGIAGALLSLSQYAERQVKSEHHLAYFKEQISTLDEVFHFTVVSEENKAAYNKLRRYDDERLWRALKAQDSNFENMLYKSLQLTLLLKMKLTKHMLLSDTKKIEVYVREDILEEYNKITKMEANNSTSTISAVRFNKEQFDIKPKDLASQRKKHKEDIKKSNSALSLFSEKREVIKDEVITWRDGLTSALPHIHEMKGLFVNCYIALAEATLREQMRKERVDDIDGLIEQFVTKMLRAAEGKPKRFRKLDTVSSERPLKFSESEGIEPGNFKYELTLRDTEYRIFIHTIVKDGTTLFYGCWFGKALHETNNVDSFNEASKLIVIDPKDLLSVTKTKTITP